MRAVERINATSMFSWVGSDGWSARSLVSDGNERAVEGTISVQPQANDVKGFKEYFLGLNVKNNKRNPWFVGTYINLLYLSVERMQLLIEIFYYLKRSTIYGYHKTIIKLSEFKSVQVLFVILKILRTLK